MGSIILDQDNDVTDPGNAPVVADTSANAGSCHNQIFASDASAASSSPGRNFGHAGTVSGTSASCGGGLYPDRNQVQIVEVTNINGNNVTISPGLYMPNWSSSKNPGAWWATTTIQGVGLENLTVDNSSSTGAGFQSITALFFNAVNCWIKNVRSIQGNRNHVFSQYTSHVEIRDSYFFKTLNAASLSYGIESWPSSDCKLENNIFQQVTTPHLEGGVQGCVFAYNFTINDVYTLADWLIPSVMKHDAAAAYNLTEGNVGSGDEGDVIHGTHNFETDFRNRWSGRDPLCNVVPCTEETIPENLMAHNRYFNIIGNVLGTSGYHTLYQTNYPANCSSTSSAANSNLSIYSLGWSADVGTPSECDSSALRILPDTWTITSLMRWGNYDTVNAAVQWNSSEVPSGVSPYGNRLPPADHILPTSFYLPSRPSWWGSMPWPAIGPDVSNGTLYGSNGATAWVAQSGLAGHANDIPALDCYKNGMTHQSDGSPSYADGTGSVLTFDANACYYAQASPAFVQGALLTDYFNTVGTTSSLSYSLPVTNGHLLWGFFTWSSATGTVTVTDSCGNSWTNVGSPVVDTNNQYSAQLAYASNAAGGLACNVTMTLSASVQNRAMIIHETSGIAASSPLDGFGGQLNAWCGAGASDCLTTGNFTTTANGDYIAAATMSPLASGATLIAGMGYTLRQQDPMNTHNVDLTSEDQVRSTPSSSTVATFSTPPSVGASAIVIAAAFKHQ
jgi:hypothetical protein